MLKRKAAERNPDEFYFAMEKKKTRDGVHEERTTEQNKYTEEELKLMKTQDLRYVSLKAQTELKRVQKMKETLHCLGAGSEERKHTIFVDEYSEAKTFKPETYFDTPRELIGRAFNRPKNSQLEDGSTRRRRRERNRLRRRRVTETAGETIEESGQAKPRRV